METRKLINFGKASYVVSLPKQWIKKHSLNKGDILSIAETLDQNLTISPTHKQGIKKQEIKYINTTGKSLQRVHREIVSAYVNDYNIIQLTGKNLKEQAAAIENIMASLIALEIIEHDSEKIIAKDFINTQEISLQELIRKMDLALRSAHNQLHKLKTQKDLNSLLARTQSIKKLRFLAVRVIKHLLEHPSPKNKPADLLIAWEVVRMIKELKTQTVHIARYIMQIHKTDLRIELLKLHIPIEKIYLETINAYYKQDTEAAYTLSSKKKEIFTSLILPLKEHKTPVYVGNVTEIYKQEARALHEFTLRFCS